MAVFNHKHLHFVKANYPGEQMKQKILRHGNLYKHVKEQPKEAADGLNKRETSNQRSPDS
jgi:hypothetical protein